MEAGKSNPAGWALRLSGWGLGRADVEVWRKSCCSIPLVQGRSAFLFYPGLQRLEEAHHILKAICFTPSTNLIVNLIQKHPHRKYPEQYLMKYLGHRSSAKLTHEIHSSQLLFFSFQPISWDLIELLGIFKALCHTCEYFLSLAS